MNAKLFDSRKCELGEGPLWHPGRSCLFWFDIIGKQLLWQEAGIAQGISFGEMVSAAGWTGPDTLLIASETRLFHYDIKTGRSDTVAELEAENPATRSNDGRADPHGGFWIGTMGKSAELRAGAIYRYFKGSLRKLHERVTIPNSICFAPDGSRAYFCDTRSGRVMVQPLDAEGWPKKEPEVFLDLRADSLNPDGSVTDAAGNIWNAQWGASRVACYSPDGVFLRAVDFPARHTSCPAFGGESLDTLYCTTARQHLDAGTLAAHPENGQTFAAQVDAEGWPEPRVAL